MVSIEKRTNLVYVATTISAILYVLGFTSFLLVLPLLFYYSRSRERVKTLLALTVLLIFVLIMEIFPLFGELSDKGNRNALYWIVLTDSTYWKFNGLGFIRWL